MKHKPGLITEIIYPYALASAATLLFLLFGEISILDDVNAALNAVLTFSSILIGFVGVLMTLIFSIKDNPIIDFILEQNDLHYKTLLKRYFNEAITSGFALLFYSIVLFFRRTIQGTGIEFLFLMIFILKCLWIFTLVYFPLTSYRVISIVLKCIFNDTDQITEDKKEKEVIESSAEYEKLKKQCDVKNK